jgi:hypothetical protein
MILLLIYYLVFNVIFCHECVEMYVRTLIYRVIRNDYRGFNSLSVWNELDYCVDVCRITKGAHIEHL